MNRPSVLTSEISLAHVKSLWRYVGPILTVGIGLALMLGFRFEKPGERVSAVELRVGKLEAAVQRLTTNSEMMLRVQCLSMTRRDADMAGACTDYPTRDESTRVRR